MVNKVRETNVPAISYLNDVKGGDVSENQDVQRRFCSDNSFINGIGVTVLTGDYLPPIILGEIPLEHGMVQQYIVDAMQRTSALMMIRFGNYKFTSTIEDSEIEYQSKKRDANGKICRDDNGSIIWEQKTYDIKGKTFDEFPDELKKRFDNFQLRIVVHQNCTMEKISKLIRRYNNHKGMNSSQRALTYLDLYARKVKTIAETEFFKNCMSFSEKENKKGTYEKLVCEATMAVFHLDNWKRNPKQMNIFLNNNSDEKEFEQIHKYCDRISKVCEDNFQDVFVTKDIAVWIAIFDKFSKTGLRDDRFFDFVQALKNDLHDKEMNGVTYDLLDGYRNTKDTKVILAKIELLESLMLEYLHISKTEDYISRKVSVLDFVKENVSKDIAEEDINNYKDDLEILSLEVDNNNPLLEEKNHPSLIALIAYTYLQDITIDSWFKDFFDKNTNYNPDQRENYIYMINSLNKFIGNGEAA